MARYWIGTSGWNYRHWRGAFYPPDLPADDWLAFYAGRFSTVELNYSFYRQPSPQSWKTWRGTVPHGFRFAVKAHRYLTHRKRLSDPGRSLNLVLKGADKLGDRLGPILYQLPPHFKRTEEHLARLEAFLELLPRDYQHAFEFRDASWFGDDTLALLRRHGVAFCFFDGLGMEPPVAATARFVYARFHGPRMYAGKYPDRLLKQWARRLQALSRDVDETYAYFNNDAQGHAVADALQLAELLDAGQPNWLRRAKERSTGALPSLRARPWH